MSASQCECQGLVSGRVGRNGGGGRRVGSRVLLQIALHNALLFALLVALRYNLKLQAERTLAALLLASPAAN